MQKEEHYGQRSLTEATLLKLAWDKEYGIKRNENGEIAEVFLYNDGTNPQSYPKYWEHYFEKIKELSKCKVKKTVY